MAVELRSGIGATRKDGSLCFPYQRRVRKTAGTSGPENYFWKSNSQLSRPVAQTGWEETLDLVREDTGARAAGFLSPSLSVVSASEQLNSHNQKRSLETSLSKKGKR